MNIEPIAYFHSPFTGKFGIPRQSGIVSSLRGEIRFTDRYRNVDAVRGMDGFDYLWLVWGFSANREQASWQPVVRPPRLGGNKAMGVFATRSPYRPNPLGLSSVRIESIDMDCAGAPVIHVLGADLMDGTPIYDIKPYVTYADSHPEARSGFVDSKAWTELKVVVTDEAEASLARLLPQESVAALRDVLAQDPRPQYQNDPGKVYGMAYEGLDVHFRVEEDVLTVIDAVRV